MNEIDNELIKIAQAHDGVLMPHDVVEFARNPNTSLHSRFEWDDSKAAHEHRLWKARQVIAMRVTILPEVNTPTRMFVSLSSDRTNTGGYRSIEWVLEHEEATQELLEQAFREFKSWEKKYYHLKALQPVFKSMERLEDKILV